MSSVSAKKPFAVGQVTNTQVVIPSYGLSAEYDARGKVSSIYEYGSWKEATFTYGPDGERWKTVEQMHNEYDVIRYFVGDMEVTTSGPGMIRCNWYLGHGVMMFKDMDNSAFNTLTPLYAFTDNQGSYIDFYRSNGTRVFEAKYDPWGVQTIVTDSIHFHRGYGGHEMLNYFGIINMDGRLYDPLLGRFLSPDNYVQEPFNTQNLNRYSYCLNNPVKYTDPSGEWFGLFSAVFGLGNMFAHHHTEGHWHFHHNLKFFAQGALAGLSLYGITQFSHYIPRYGNIVKSTVSVGYVVNMFSGVAGTMMGICQGLMFDRRGAQLSKRLLYGQFNLSDSFLKGIIEGISRFTWESPQTAIGHVYNQVYNFAFNADRVDYLDGVTFLTKYKDVNGIKEGRGVTLGNFINIRNNVNNVLRPRIQGPFEEYVLTNQLYMHEYGHYIDSHHWGPSYLFSIGVPSLGSATIARFTNHRHSHFWSEKRANRRAWRHFRDYYGLQNWQELADGIHTFTDYPK